ncbi:MAG: hypothetical protein QOH37_1234 [Nocardioidaceae bacterium]|nr:hypothetical protein [Nocardioidaceae bacterium]
MFRNAPAPDSIPAPDPAGPGEAQVAPAGAGAAPSPGRRRRRRVGIALAGVVGLALVWSPWRGNADVRDGTTVVDRDGMAARHGVDINLIAVTAAGGLIELRMQVTDPDKAAAVIHDDQDRPVLVSEETGQTLTMASPPHQHGALLLGGQYFFLLANAHNALHAGSEVTVVIDDSRIEHVEVQG